MMDTLEDISIDKEEYGQINLFVGQDLLLFEAEAFDFGEVGCDLE